MNNKFFTLSLIAIGIICILFTYKVSAFDTNMSISNETLILLFAFFIFSFGLYKEDTVIGFLCCYGAGFIFASAIFNGIVDSSLHTYIYVIIFLCIGIGTYKSFIYYDDNYSNRGKE